MIPYLSFYIFLTFLQYHSFGIPDFNVHIEYYFKGGEYLKGTFGVFWFVTSLYVLSILFHIIFLLKNNIVLFAVALIFYLFSYYDSINYNNIFFVWNINTVLFTFIFYYLGYLYKKHENKISHLIENAILPTGILILVFIVLNIYGLFDYKLDIKYQIYNHLFIDIAIPLLFIVFILGISRKLEDILVINKTLSIIGQSSLTIMYLHIFLLSIFQEYTPLALWQIILFSIVLPSFTHQVFKTTRITSTIFLGTQPTRNE